MALKKPSGGVASSGMGRIVIIGKGIGKESVRGAERCGNLVRLLSFVRNDDSFYDHLFKSFTIILGIFIMNDLLRLRACPNLEMLLSENNQRANHIPWVRPLAHQANLEIRGRLFSFPFSSPF